MIPVACFQRLLDLRQNKIMLTYELHVVVQPHQTTEPFDNKEMNVHWFLLIVKETHSLTSALLQQRFEVLLLYSC